MSEDQKKWFIIAVIIAILAGGWYYNEQQKNQASWQNWWNGIWQTEQRPFWEDWFSWKKEPQTWAEAREERRDEQDRKEYEAEKSEKPSVYLRDIAGVFTDYNLIMPNGNRIRFCSAFTCTHKQIYRLSADDLRAAKGFLDDAWTPRGEREGLEKALQELEKRMGPALGVDRDKQGGSFWANGNPGQMNATDEALNVTSILLVMYRYELIRYHDLERPQWKGGALYPVIRDRRTGERFGIDAGYRDHGGEIKIFPWRGRQP